MQDFLGDGVSVKDDHDQVSITLYLLEHMLGFDSFETGNSFFQPYFDTLPKSLEAFSSMPVTWNQKDMALLHKSPMAYLAAVRYKKDRRHDYEVFSLVGGSFTPLCISHNHGT